MIAEWAGLDVLRIWTTREVFFKRLAKSQLIDGHVHIVGQSFRYKTLSKCSKADVANWLGLIFKSKKGAPRLDQDQCTRAKEWVSEGMVWAASTSDDKA